MISLQKSITLKFNCCKRLFTHLRSSETSLSYIYLHFVASQKQVVGQDPHVIAALLKRYFSELPEPIIPFIWYDRFIAAALLPTEEEQVAELDRLVPQLSPDRQKVMEYLLQHLGRYMPQSLYYFCFSVSSFLSFMGGFHKKSL